MLKLIGTLLLMIGSVGAGWSAKNCIKENLNALYSIRQMFRMLQNEIIYTKASLPEACRQIGSKTKEPFKEAFEAIYMEMSSNSGSSFQEIWSSNMESCLKKLPVGKEDRRTVSDFGGCAGYMDGQMQAKAVEQYIHSIDLSVKRLEEEINGKCKVIMSLSVMGGLLAVIILI